MVIAQIVKFLSLTAAPAFAILVFSLRNNHLSACKYKIKGEKMTQLSNWNQYENIEEQRDQLIQIMQKNIDPNLKKIIDDTNELIKEEEIEYEVTISGNQTYANKE